MGMWSRVQLFLVVLIGGCHQACGEGNISEEVLVESATRGDCGAECERVDLVVYCDGRYEYRCAGCEQYAGRLDGALLSQLKEALGDPLTFQYRDGTAHYWYREGDVKHRGRDPTMATVYRFVEGEYQSKPNRARNKLGT